MLIGAMLAAPCPAAPPRPNFLLILTDDLGYGDLTCFGHKDTRTPRLDAMAADGVRLTAFYVTSPVCSPTRASFMTGRHPQRFDIHHADLPERLPRYPLPEDAVTVAELLKNDGYLTGHYGKWHLGEPPLTPMPRRHGFDRFFGGMGGRPSSSWSRWARSNDPQMFTDERPATTYPGHVTDVTTDHCLEFLEHAVAQERPFYVNLWFNAPHAPLTPQVDQIARFAERDDLSQRQKVYYATVENLDANVGRILEKLEALGVADNTLVLFTSDNGPESHSYRYAAGSTGPLRGIKTQLWEGGIRVPTIARYPDALAGGRVYAQPASALDWVPTVCALAGIETPQELDEGMNLMPLLSGEASPEPRSLYFEFHYPQRKPRRDEWPLTHGDEPSGPLVMRRGDWKLHMYPDLGRVRLYHLATDPGEQTELAEQHPHIAGELAAELEGWYATLPHEGPNLEITRVPVPETEEEANRLPLAGAR